MSCECVGCEIGRQGVSTFFSVSCDVCINLTITSNCKQKRRLQWWCTKSKKWCTTGSICFGLGHKYVLICISCFYLIYLSFSITREVLSVPARKRRILGNGFIEWRKTWNEEKPNEVLEHILKKFANNIYPKPFKRYREIILAYLMFSSIKFQVSKIQPFKLHWSREIK